jgi:hypothetical protein
MVGCFDDENPSVESVDPDFFPPIPLDLPGPLTFAVVAALLLFVLDDVCCEDGAACFLFDEDGILPTEDKVGYNMM